MTFETIKRSEVLKTLREAKNVKNQKKILCDMLYCSPAELEELIKQLESERKAPHKWTSRESEELIYMYNAGKSTEEICLKFGVEKKQTIYDKIKRLKKEGKILSRKPKKDFKNTEEIKMNNEDIEVTSKAKESQNGETTSKDDDIMKMYRKTISRQSEMFVACNEVLRTSLELIDKLYKYITVINGQSN